MVICPLPVLIASTDELPPAPGATLIRSGVIRTAATVPQQSTGVMLDVSVEPPIELSGRVITAPWGLVQPVQRPTASVVASREEPSPEAGRTLRSAGGRLPFDNTPPVRAKTFAAEVQLPEAGRFLLGEVGFPDARRPQRPVLIAPEVQAPAPGSVLAGKPPPPGFVPQQAPGEVVVAVREELPPEAGRFLARAFGRVPSDRYVVRPTMAVSEEPRPAEGVAIVRRVTLGNPPPNRPFAPLARIEEPQPEAGRAIVTRVWVELPPPVRARICAAEPPPVFAGWWLANSALPAVLPPQQLPGRVVMACVEAPRPEEGRTMLVTGVNAGAIPPNIG